MTQYWLWTLFAAIVAAILFFDLVVLGRRRAGLTTRQALTIVAAYVAAATGFGWAILASVGAGGAMEYLTAYLLEQSLSLDNILMWVLIFEQLKVPEQAQQKVLFWGIMGAMAFRGLFILAGVGLIAAFEWILYGFGALVLYSGVRLLRSRGGLDFRLADSRVLKLLRRHLSIAGDYQGRAFFVRHGGRLCGTPLVVALIVIETTDLVFALDSLPAIFGVTRDPLIIYTSNVFAIIGLRALYFAVAGLMEDLEYLRYGLSLLLVLIGLKMIGGQLVEVPVWATLAATVTIIVGTVVASLLHRNGRAPAARGR